MTNQALRWASGILAVLCLVFAGCGDDDNANLTQNFAGQLACSGTLSPGGRWCDQKNGTVLDMTTGLVWLQNANCAALGPAALYYASINARTLADGACGLTDGSQAGQWRLPTIEELGGIVPNNNYSYDSGPEPVSFRNMRLFSGVQSDSYWSSSYAPNRNTYVWIVNMNYSYVLMGEVSGSLSVWPVRSGQ